ncbi:MAG: hypothetical protein U0324_21135 [Polyangiales bacterium]
MQNATATDLPAVLKESVEVSVRTDNVVPLLVDALIVISLGVCTLGFFLPPLLHGYTTMCLRAVRGEKISVGESFRGIERFVPALILGLALLGLVLLGSVVPVVGNLAALCVGWWAFCASVERPELGALDAVKASLAFTMAHPIETLVVAAIGVGLNALLAATAIGAVVTTAFSGVLTAVAWSRLSRPAPALGYPPRA